MGTEKTLHSFYVFTIDFRHSWWREELPNGTCMLSVHHGSSSLLALTLLFSHVLRPARPCSQIRYGNRSGNEIKKTPVTKYFKSGYILNGRIPDNTDNRCSPCAYNFKPTCFSASCAGSGQFSWAFPESYTADESWIERSSDGGQRGDKRAHNSTTKVSFCTIIIRLCHCLIAITKVYSESL